MPFSFRQPNINLSEGKCVCVRVDHKFRVNFSWQQEKAEGKFSIITQIKRVRERERERARQSWLYQQQANGKGLMEGQEKCRKFKEAN